MFFFSFKVPSIASTKDLKHHPKHSNILKFQGFFSQPHVRFNRYILSFFLSLLQFHQTSQHYQYVLPQQLKQPARAKPPVIHNLHSTGPDMVAQLWWPTVHL